MVDAIQQALDQGRPLDNPNILKEDNPPLLRFTRGTLENRRETLETGRFGYRDAIFVHIRAYGDNKTEVPHVVKKIVDVATTEQIMIEKMVPVLVERTDPDTGIISQEEEFRKKTVMEERKTFKEAEIWPWFDILDFRLQNGFISQRISDYCHMAYEKWAETGIVKFTDTQSGDS